MTSKQASIDNAKFVINAGFAAVLIYAVYKLSTALRATYEAVDTVVDAAVDPLADVFFNSEFYQGDGVELTSFDISRLYRDYFDENWVMKPGPLAVISKAYPDEMSVLLNESNQLLPEYHSHINQE